MENMIGINHLDQTREQTSKTISRERNVTGVWFLGRGECWK